uniref:Uncharacterized protein n=1 Tax=viral metagenome TaxID=1070528 RepID=A0A6M3KLE6_9ZZZZ
MTDKERIAEKLKGLPIVTDSILGDKRDPFYLNDCDIEDVIKTFESLGYTRQPENIQGYTLTCQKCGKGYFSEEAFPGVQICPDCYEPPQDKEYSFREVIEWLKPYLIKVTVSSVGGKLITGAEYNHRLDGTPCPDRDKELDYFEIKLKPSEWEAKLKELGIDE